MLILPFATHPQILSAAFMTYINSGCKTSLSCSMKCDWLLLPAWRWCGNCLEHSCCTVACATDLHIPWGSPAFQSCSLHCPVSPATLPVKKNWTADGQKGCSWFSHRLKYHYFRLWFGGTAGFSGHHQPHKQTQPWWKMTALNLSVLELLHNMSLLWIVK